MGDNRLEDIRGQAGIPVVTTSGNHMVFSCPKATTRPLPAITGPVTVTFKCEHTIADLAIGPVTVIDQQRYDASDETSVGRYALGWVTQHVAGEIAKYYGVALKEF